MALAVLTGLRREEVAEAEPHASSEPPAVNVSCMKLKPATLDDEVKLAGRLEPWVEVQISTELGGTVQEVGFDKGHRVAKGQVLAHMGTDLFEAALAEAEAALPHADSDFTKTTELFERQAVPRQELISATSDFHGAQARVQQAKLRVERSIIRSPVAGIGVSREIELGEFVPAGTLVTTVHQVSRLKAIVGIPEDDIAFFKVGGARHTSRVDAYPDESFTGAMHFLAPAATGQNRTFPVEIAIDNARGELRPGMIVRVPPRAPRLRRTLIVVPRDAMLERDTGHVAFVLEGRPRGTS